jgi:hypothetical protein
MYHAVNTLRLGYKNQSVNAAYLNLVVKGFKV